MPQKRRKVYSEEVTKGIYTGSGNPKGRRVVKGMMIFRKIRKHYPLFVVLRTMRDVKPLGTGIALSFYTAPLKWIAQLGRVSYFDLLPSPLVIDSRLGVYVMTAEGVRFLDYEAYEVDNFVLKLINKDTVFIDVGAYIGMYTVVACRRARRVLAVEPNPLALVYLRANVALNKCSNTTIVPKAVSSGKDLVKLKMPKPARKGRVPIDASIVWSFDDMLEVSVEADTLDNIVDEASLDTVDFVKIDVEGAEGLVVKGAEKTLRKAKALLIEIRPENAWVVKHLKTIGYKLVDARKYNTPTGYYLNCFFLKQS